MTQAKFVKIGGAWKSVTAEFVKIGGAWKSVTTNAVKIGGSWKDIGLAERRIYVTEQTSERCYRVTNEGAEDWVYYAGGLVDPVAVAVDSAGNSYWACTNNIYKLDNDGNLVWSRSYRPYDVGPPVVLEAWHNSPVKSICVDADGYVYSGDFAGVVQKTSPTGDHVWRKSLGANYAVYALAIDAGTMLYAGTGFAYDAVYRLQIVNGNSARIYTSTSGDITAIAVDDDGNLYVGDGTGHYRKMSIGGAVDWTQTPGGGITQMVIGHDGYGYCSDGSARELIKFARASGTPAWTYDPGGTAYAMGVGVDQGGRVYGAYQKAGNSVENVIRQVDSSGNWVWSWSPYVSAQFYGLAVTPGIKSAGFE